MPKFLRVSSIASAVAIALLAVSVSACYVPVNFDANVTINRKGQFEMAYDGKVVWAPLYEKLRRGKLTRTEEREAVATIETDLARDSSFSEIKYDRHGYFRVRWEKSGDLLRSKMISFIRRNERLLSLKYVSTSGQITLNGTSVSRSRAQQLIDKGLGIAGALTVRTDAKVVDHNAHSVTEDQFRWRTYSWRVRSPFDPSPRLVITMR